jgi:HK97 family phage portal protein
MNRFLNTFMSWLGRGGATAQRDGKQVIAPSVVVHDNAPAVSIDGALQVSTVWACVDLLTKVIGSLPLFVYFSASRQPARATLIYRLLHESPNAVMTAMEFWVCMLLNLYLRGNAYAAITRNAAGEAISLWPLMADQTEAAVLEDGSMVYGYSTDKGVEVIAAENMLHIKGLGNGRVGLSRLDMMRASVGMAITANNFARGVFANNGKRGGVLMMDRILDDKQRALVRQNFKDLTEGSGAPLYILEANAKYEQLGLTPADTQLLESRRFSVEDLCRWFGVPSVLVNDTAKTTTWGTGVEQIVEGFYKFTVGPELERIEQAITKRVLTPRQRAELTVEFNFEGLLRTSLSTRMAAYQIAVQNGLKTRNECRQLENDPPLPGGDQLTVQMQMMPLSAVPQAGAPNGTQTNQP